MQGFEKLNKQDKKLLPLQTYAHYKQESFCLDKKYLHQKDFYNRQFELYVDPRQYSKQQFAHRDFQFES